MKRLKRNLSLGVVLLLNQALLAASAHAAGEATGLPWEGALVKVAKSLSGPVAQSIAVIAIVTTGLMVAFGEGGSGVRKALWVAFGLALTFGAASFLSSLLGVSLEYGLS